ncbi:glycoside hydrolase family 13 protein [Pelomyxa schiedti]|nr:glycoside hydrolase family 13 protein [Pelomyxa schiedti]
MSTNAVAPEAAQAASPTTSTTTTTSSSPSPTLLPSPSSSPTPGATDEPLAPHDYHTRVLPVDHVPATTATPASSSAASEPPPPSAASPSASASASATTTTAAADDGSAKSWEKYRNASDGTGVVLWDSWLSPYVGVLRGRYSHYAWMKSRIAETESSLLDFARSYKTLGFHRGVSNGVRGVHYTEYAPAATNMRLVGDFNGWNPNTHYMRKVEWGRWHLFVPDHPDGTPGIAHNSKLKVSVENGHGKWSDHVPPWITRAVQNDKFIYDGVYWDPPNPYAWKYPLPSRNSALDGPKIYECHIGMASIEPRVGTYREFMRDVLPHVVDLGYNCIQLMAVMEHAYYASFGYQVTNFFAVSSRYGTPEDLKELIDQCHKFNIYVLLDVVHSHASLNVLDGINNFDGGDYLFHSGQRGYHGIWGSRLFDYAKWETLRFLLSNLVFYLEEYRFDGFRFDGVTSMLYHHHGIGDHNFNYDHYFGGSVDHDALTYLTLANDVIHEVRPGALSIAEDVSGFACLCRPVSEGGVGFDFRLQMACPDLWVHLLKSVKDENWNMGSIAWTLMNRRWMEPCISYAESHDQSLVGDKTCAFWLMDKEMYTNMSVLQPPSAITDRGIALHKMIRLVTLLLGGEGYLNFMGNEFGHPEWVDFPRPGNNYSHHYARRRWDLAHDPLLRYRHLLVFDSAMILMEEKHKFLMSPGAHVTYTHEEDKLLCFERGGLVCIFNFHTSNSYPDRKFPVSRPGTYSIVLDSDRLEFGGYIRVDTSKQIFSSPNKMGTYDHTVQAYIPCRTAIVLAKVE